MAQTNDYLEKEPLGKLMRKYAFPCVISMLVAALYNIVDQIFIANASYLGSYGNAANTIVFPMTVIAIAIAVMIGDGSCTYVSISLGAKESKNAKSGVGNAVLAVIIASILLTGIYLIFQDAILSAFGARVNLETFKFSKEYFFWITAGIPFYMFAQAMNPVIRSDGNPKFAMNTLLIGAIINVILDPLFIFVFKWGMTGAALATILGQIVSAVMAGAYLFKMEATPLDRQCFILNKLIIKKILSFGMASFFSQFAIVLSMAATINMAVKFGAVDKIFSLEEYSQIPTAIAGIVSKFFQIVISISAGLAAGCIPIAGYNLGAKQYARVIELMKLLMKTQALIGLFASIIFLLFPNQLMLLFGSKHESIYYTEFAVWFIRAQLCLLPFACLNKASFIFLQSLGRAKESSLLSILREFIFGVGFTILLPFIWGLYALPLFMPAADIASFIFVAIVLAGVKKNLQESSKETVFQTAKDNYLPNDAPKTQMIITVSRTYGSGGRTIAKKLSQKLCIPYYDAVILEETAKKSGLSQKFISEIDEKPIPTNQLYRYLSFHSNECNSLETMANQAQREVIEAVARKGACIILGRRADLILKDCPNLFRIFITSPRQARILRISKRDNLSENKSEQAVLNADKERALYYSQYCDKPWGSAENYDLCMDTEKFGIEKTVEIILSAINALEK
ncbi:MAG: cytidylate kinase family protein [Candidatus Gastranaerophilales bacterium]|nr:cytidylate kinase family protein [Candidatus Gastranaerophilales bacterium]